MITLLKKFINQETIRYLVAGVLTTLVNLGLFYILRNLFHMNLNASNFIAITLAICFAYVINKLYVFKSTTHNIEAIINEILTFFGARLITMFIEIAGVALFVSALHMNEMVSKLLIQVVVLVLNYIFSKLFIFTKKDQSDKPPSKLKVWAKKNRLHLFAFLIPFLILVMICVAYEVEPFGDQSLVIIDGLHQYMPFFSTYQEKLLTGDSLLYSWNAGLGVNFLALWAYYLSSPFNLLIVFVKQEYLNAVISFTIILKIALSGMAMSYYLAKSPTLAIKYHTNSLLEPVARKTQLNNSLILIFSTGFALSNYMIGYSWNVMWMDSVAIFPIVILGVVYLIKKNDGRLYGLALFISLFCNFYISFMTCLFLVLYFLLFQHESVKKFFQKGFIFAGYSLVAAGMAAVVLIPTYNGLMMTSSAKLQFPKPELYTNFIDIITAHSVIFKPLTNLQEDGGVNLYCGVLAIMLLNLYILNRKIKRSVRVKNVLILVFLILSFNLNTLNYIWHGFHDQYGIPNRFAYIYIFMVLVMAYQVLVNIKSYSKALIIWSYVICNGFLVVSALLSKEPANWWTYVITAVMLSIYLIILLKYQSWKISYHYFRYLITFVVVVELGVNAFYGYAENGQIQISKFFSDTKAVNQVKNELEYDTDFYRAELAKSKMLDEVTWHNLKGVNLFGSTAIGDVVYTMGRLGFYSAANEYLYRGGSPLTDSMLGVKYLLVREKQSAHGNFEYINTVDNIDIYKNKYALPIGYMVTPNAKDISYKLTNPFTVHNNIVNGTMEDPVTLYEAIEIPDPFITNYCTTDRQSTGYYSFENTESADDNIVFKLKQQEDSDLYFYISGNQIEKINIKNGEEEVVSDKLNSQIIHVGYVGAGNTVTISLRLKDDETNSGNINVMAASLDDDAFNTYYDSLNDETLKVTNYTSTKINGTIDVKEDGLFLTSIPYDKGWKVLVDGKIVSKEDITPTMDAFLTFPLTKGSHTIEMEYQPLGYYFGFMLTGGSVTLYLLTFLFHKRRKNKKKF